MPWLWANVPLMVLFVALWVGVPTWLVLKHPDKKPAPVVAPALRGLAYRPETRRSEETSYRRAACPAGSAMTPGWAAKVVSRPDLRTETATASEDPRRPPRQKVHFTFPS